MASKDEPPLDVARFEAAVGTPFTIRFDDGVAVVLVLTEVEHLRAPAGWEHFALLFDGPEPALGQWTYAVEHGTMGTFPMFLGPIARGASGVRYEAVFYRHGPGGAPD